MTTALSSIPADHHYNFGLKKNVDEFPQELEEKQTLEETEFYDSSPERIISTIFGSSSQDDSLINCADFVIRQVAQGLANLSALNTSFAGGAKDRLSKFSCVVEPQIPLVDYIIRLSSYLEAWKTNGKVISARALILSLVYIERIYRLHPGARTSSKNVHKIILVSMLIAVKFLEDKPLSNSYWAKVGGIELKELNRLEGEFCNLVGFEFHVAKAELLSPTLRCCMIQST